MTSSLRRLIERAGFAAIAPTESAIRRLEGANTGPERKRLTADFFARPDRG
ncbi:MAG TPA: hypothetical protein VGH15_12980 [Caulobacteraceae bacterium]